MKCQFCSEDVAPFDISHAFRLQDALSRGQIERTNQLQQIMEKKMGKIGLEGKYFQWHDIAGECVLADQDGAVRSRVRRDGELWGASVSWEEEVVHFLSCEQAKAGVQSYVRANGGLMGVETVEPSESIDDLEISARPYNALTKEGITTVAKSPTWGVLG